jgi:hypothetical protein
MLFPVVAVFAVLISSGVQAVPVDYSVAYDGSKIGPAGTGSFAWDSVTSQFSNFNWNFGGSTDTLMANNWRSSIFGGTMGQFLFEILSGEDVHPAACSANSRCSFSTGNLTSSLLTSAEFRTIAPGMTEYLFRNGANILFNGTLSVTRILATPAQAVTEPFTLSLMGAALLGLALRRRFLR